MSKTLLLVDDDVNIRRPVIAWLKRAGWDIEVLTCGEKVVETAGRLKPDMVLMDVLLGDADGRKLCTLLRADARLAHTPVILISGSKTELGDQVAGLRGGADDYILKPLSEHLLLAKIDVVLARYRAPKEASQTMKYLGISVDVSARLVKVGKRSVALTRKEFDLLTAMLKRRGHVNSTNFLLESVWGYESETYNDPRTVQVHMSRIKRKLGKNFSSHVVSVVGLGYRLD